MGVDVLGSNVRLVADGAGVHQIDGSGDLWFADRAASSDLQRRISFGADLIGEERRGRDVEVAVNVDVEGTFVHQSDGARCVDLAGRSGQVELLDRSRTRGDGDRRRLLLREVEPAERDVQILECDLPVERAEVRARRADLRLCAEAAAQLRWCSRA